MELEHARVLAVQLLEEHGLWQQEWVVNFNRTATVFGRCWNGRKLIQLSKHLVELNEESHVKDTILHEIAHALTPGHKHDKIWQAKAKEIGCNGKRFYDKTVVVPKKKFVGTCKNCGRQIFRNARKRIACGICCRKFSHGKFDVGFTFEWDRT